MKYFRIELDNNFEADVLSALFEEEKIPFRVFNHYDLAYDGLFQLTTGWGHFEIQEEYQEKAEKIFQNYKNSLLF
ncbi:MAG: hypothetical protein ACYCYI_12980 [Saccharofermentanales bacterium]